MTFADSSVLVVSVNIFSVQEIKQVFCADVMGAGLVFRAAGARGLQRTRTRLGPGLWPPPASSAGRRGALLHPVPPGLPECTGLRVDFHLMVSRPVSSKTHLSAPTMFLWTHVDFLLPLMHKLGSSCSFKSKRVPFLICRVFPMQAAA